jgi:hypothetical protein
MDYIYHVPGQPGLSSGQPEDNAGRAKSFVTLDQMRSQDQFGLQHPASTKKKGVGQFIKGMLVDAPLNMIKGIFSLQGILMIAGTIGLGMLAGPVAGIPLAIGALIMAKIQLFKGITSGDANKAGQGVFDVVAAAAGTKLVPKEFNMEDGQFAFVKKHPDKPGVYQSSGTVGWFKALFGHKAQSVQKVGLNQYVVVEGAAQKSLRGLLFKSKPVKNPAVVYRHNGKDFMPVIKQAGKEPVLSGSGSLKQRMQILKDIKNDTDNITFSYEEVTIDHTGKPVIKPNGASLPMETLAEIAEHQGSVMETVGAIRTMRKNMTAHEAHPSRVHVVNLGNDKALAASVPSSESVLASRIEPSEVATSKDSSKATQTPELGETAASVSPKDRPLYVDADGTGHYRPGKEETAKTPEVFYMGGSGMAHKKVLPSFELPEAVTTEARQQAAHDFSLLNPVELEARPVPLTVKQPVLPETAGTLSAKDTMQLATEYKGNEARIQFFEEKLAESRKNEEANTQKRFYQWSSETLPQEHVSSIQKHIDDLKTHNEQLASRLTGESEFKTLQEISDIQHASHHTLDTLAKNPEKKTYKVELTPLPETATPAELHTELEGIKAEIHILEAATKKDRVTAYTKEQVSSINQSRQKLKTYQTQLQERLKSV